MSQESRSGGTPVIIKNFILTSSGVDKVLYEIFSIIADNYLRMCAIDTAMNSTSSNAVQNKAIYNSMKTKQDVVYGFELDMDESDPSSMIRYLGMNIDYKPAYMDFNEDKFYYGDWKDAWFIKDINVVAMNYNGVIEAKLSTNNYNRVDSTGNGVIGLIEPGTLDNANVMVGIPTVWIKVDTTISRKPRFYFAPTQLDSTYHAYAHTNADGVVVPYIYMAAYEGYSDGNRIRSLSGYAPTRNQILDDQITQCRANNVNGDNMWDLQSLADHELIILLLMLIGRSTNSQAVFGNGNVSGYTNPATNADEYGILPTGTMNTKGLFWGSSETNLGVKVFGIENFWGNTWKRIFGLINVNGTIKYKLTRGTQDGSTATDYITKNNDGAYDYSTDGWTGYLKAGDTSDITTATNITDMYVGDFGLLPKAASSTGSSSTYYCDRTWVNNAQIDFGQYGGGPSVTLYAGMFCFHMGGAFGGNWSINVGLTYRPSVELSKQEISALYPKSQQSHQGR